MRRLDSGRLSGILAGALVALVGLAQAPWNPILDRLEFDHLVRITRNLPPELDSPVAVVGLDDRAVRALSATTAPGFDRAAFARLVESISAAGPRVLAVDVLFREPRDAAGDESLARAIAGAPGAVIAAAWRSGQTQQQRVLLEPMRALSSRGIAIGVTNTWADADGVVRHLALVQTHDGNELPHMALEAARRYLGTTSTSVSGSLLVLAGPAGVRRVPIEPRTSTLLVPYAGRDRFKIVPASDLLENGPRREAAREKLKGKLVLVGATGNALGDLHLTPHGAPYGRPALVPGVLILAHAAEGIITGKLVGELGDTVSFVLLLGAVAAVSLLFAVFSPLFAFIGLAGIVGALWLACSISFEAGTLLGGLRLLSAVGATCVVCLIVRWVELYGLHARTLRWSGWDWLDRSGPEPGTSGVAAIVSLGSRDLARSGWRRSTPELAAALESLLRVGGDLEESGACVELDGPSRLLAVFGLRRGEPNCPVAACTAVRGAMTDLTVRWSAIVHAGPVTAGRLGAGRRRWSVFLGPEVELARRLISMADEYGVGLLVTDPVRQQCGEGFTFREIDRLRAGDRVFAVHELVGLEEALTDPFRALVEAYDSALQRYYRMDWVGARDDFYRALEIVPDDGPSRLMLTRVEAFRTQAPPEGWAGARTIVDG
ncbi:MAG: CHASE2 domain-containing protein [Candidatus Riflebacteria bacterium]|nr:CHASE2 domain-containing protein [Candidatus Riflebacteria bacterium]